MTFSTTQKETLAHMDEMLRVRMKNNVKRYEHSCAVSTTAIDLAQIYEVDQFNAAVAGLLHDWDKVLGASEILARAAQLGVMLHGSPLDVAPLLHGPVAAYELPHVFSEVSAEIAQAIERHTTGHTNMSDLDMVIFVADAIEPHRFGSYADELRKLVGEVDLETLFFKTFAQGMLHIISQGRFLYPTATDVYNAYAQRIRHTAV